ncbi:MAG: helix-turn-helix transcriptional regulator [Thaumarchaeota archaeon]|nr:helix-turn-helix transcriptional regulator [Nitrososphaerota archaeon]
MTPDSVTLIIVFSALFVAQTAIYTYLLLRLRSRLKAPAQGPPVTDTSRDVTQITDSMAKILRELKSRGPLTAREISSSLGLSREHTARTLKRLVEEGLLVREGKPYRYRLTGLGEEALRSRDVTA